MIADPFRILDLNLSDSPQINPEDALGSNSSVANKLVNTIKSFEKEKQKKYKSKKFKGVVLEANIITESQCRARTSDLFWESTKDSAGSIGEKIYDEYYVYIPEVTGCYPTFDYDEYIKLRNSFGYATGLRVTNSAAEKKITKSQAKSKYIKYKKILTKLRRFPRFYAVRGNMSATNGQIVEVEFTDMNNISHGRFLGRPKS